MRPKIQPNLSATRLLVDLLCNVVAMRSDHHGALVRELALPVAGKPAGWIQRQVATQDDDADDTGEQVLPWEEAIYEVQNGIAVVQVAGPVVKGYDAITCWYWGLMSSDRLQAAISELSARDDVAAVVFNFNSPGGMVTGTPEVGDAIRALDAKKLTVAFTSDMACSAAYWMACACRAVFVTRSAIIGSIGTYIALYDYTEMLKEWGISLELFRAGKLKAIGVMGKPLTDEERQFLTGCVDRINTAFTGFVKERRDSVADSTMQGQWFDGSQAVELGLADAVVPGLDDVLASLRGNMQPATVANPI